MNLTCEPTSSVCHWLCAISHSTNMECTNVLIAKSLFPISPGTTSLLAVANTSHTPERESRNTSHTAQKESRNTSHTAEKESRNSSIYDLIQRLRMEDDEVHLFGILLCYNVVHFLLLDFG